MSEAEYPPKLEDLARVPWEQVIEGSGEKTCFRYGCLFCGKAHDEADPTIKPIWKFFARTTSFALTLDAAEGGAFGAIVDAFSEDEIALMKQLAPTVKDAELRARMSDIIWTRQRKGNFPFVKTAIASYLESARRLEDPDHWVEGEQRVERASQLAFSLGNPELRQQVVDYIKEVIERCNGEDPSYLSARMMNLLIKQQEGDPAKYALLARELAEAAEREEDFHRAKDYWDIVAAWHQLASDDDAARQAAIAAAETFVKEAEKRRRQPAAPYMHASSNIAFAIEAYRKISGTQDRVAELHCLLINYQQKSVSEYARFESGPIDLSPAAEEARRRVEGKPFYDALFSLAMLLKPTSIAYAREQAEKQAKEFVFKSIFPSTQTNAMGRTIARQSSVSDSSEEEAEKALLFDMFQIASHGWQLYAQGVIEPARHQIKSEYESRVRDFAALVGDNPFVPPGRQVLYARGLHAGMTGDFVTVAHLLIPQVEHSIRCILYQNGFVASGIDPEGIQREFDLNTMLKDSRFKPALEKIFGEDTVFDLRALLVEPAGANLRNMMAHGLLNSNAFYCYTIRYFWWLTLRLCCIPIIAHLQGARPANQPEDAGEHEAQPE